MSWIIASSAIVTALATVVLAIITWRYVRLTKEILKTSDKPEILIFLFPNEKSLYRIDLCIQNIGTGFASDVKFTGDLSFRSFRKIPCRKVSAKQCRLLLQLRGF